jgi:hypothetical protein
MAAKTFTLYSPEGEKYDTSDRAEVTRLKARGYTDSAPKKSAPQSDPKK